MNRERKLSAGEITQLFNDNDHALATIGNKLTERKSNRPRLGCAIFYFFWGIYFLLKPGKGDMTRLV